MVLMTVSIENQRTDGYEFTLELRSAIAVTALSTCGMNGEYIERGGGRCSGGGASTAVHAPFDRIYEGCVGTFCGNAVVHCTCAVLYACCTACVVLVRCGGTATFQSKVLALFLTVRHTQRRLQQVPAYLVPGCVRSYGTGTTVQQPSTQPRLLSRSRSCASAAASRAVDSPDLFLL